MNNIDLTLYLVTDRKLCKERDLPEIVEQAVKGGVTVVQLREKECSSRELYHLAVKMKSLLAAFSFKVPLLINDRPDIALASGADGVHLGQSDLPPAVVRKLLGKNAFIGLSVESLSQVEEAEKLDVDYLAISPVCATPTKTDTLIEWGLEGIKQISSISSYPLVAIGGINRSNAGAIIEAGADGIAVVAAICSAENPYTSANELKNICLKHLNSRKITPLLSESFKKRDFNSSG